MSIQDYQAIDEMMKREDMDFESSCRKIKLLVESLTGEIQQLWIKMSLNTGKKILTIELVWIFDLMDFRSKIEPLIVKHYKLVKIGSCQLRHLQKR